MNKIPKFLDAYKTVYLEKFGYYQLFKRGCPMEEDDVTPASSPHGGVTESLRHGRLAMVTTELCLYTFPSPVTPVSHQRG
jgi:hypothetical protein